MFYNIIIYLLAFTSMVCYGYVREISSPIADLGKQGAIFKSSPEEKLTMIFHSKEGTIKLDKWLKVGADIYVKDFHLRCFEFVKGNNELKQYRVNYHVKKTNIEDEEIEVDDFAVTSCNGDMLEKTILFYTTKANVYTVKFRDTSSNSRKACFQREIEVEEKEFSSVTRTKPVTFDCNKIRFLKENEGLVVPDSWMPDGTLDDMYIPDVRLQFPLLGNGKCEDCYVTCKWTIHDKGKFGVVDVVVRGVAVDRLYSTSCTQYTLDTSIWLHEVRDTSSQERTDYPNLPLTLIYLNYLDPKGVCKRRKINLDQKPVEKEPFLKHVTFQRFEFYEVTCVKMKSRGLLRAVVKRILS